MSTQTSETTIAEIGGKSYTLSPLNFRDFGTIAQWMRVNLLRSTAEALASAGPAERKAMADAAIREAGRIGFFTHADTLNDPEAIAMLVWLSLRKLHSKLTVEDVVEMFPPSAMAELNRVAKLVAQASGVGAMLSAG